MKRFDFKKWCAAWSEYKHTKKAKRHFIIMGIEGVILIAVIVLNIIL